MKTRQNYAATNSQTNPDEKPAPTLPPDLTKNLYRQIEIFRNIYLLSENPYYVNTYSQLLTNVFQRLSINLEQVIKDIDPSVMEAITSRPLD